MIEEQTEEQTEEEIEVGTEEETEEDPTPADFTLVRALVFFFFLLKEKVFYYINALLYLGKVSRYVREQELRDLFARFGRIRDMVLRVCIF